VGQAAYQLALPSNSKLHPVFHVSCLKKVIGAKCQIQTNLLELAEEGSIWLQPEEVLDQREHRLCHRTIKEVASPVERYNSSRCHLGTNYHSATISSSQALRKRLFLRGRTC
jgi:hypothetical protein